MIIYKFECLDCGHEFTQMVERGELETDCEQSDCCGRAVYRPSMAKPVLFRAGFYEHASPEGVYAETPQQLQDALNANDGISPYLEDSCFKVRRNYDATAEKKEKALAERRRREALEAQGCSSLV